MTSHSFSLQCMEKQESVEHDGHGNMENNEHGRCPQSVWWIQMRCMILCAEMILGIVVLHPCPFFWPVSANISIDSMALGQKKRGATGIDVFPFFIWQCVKTLYPCSSHQNSW